MTGLCWNLPVLNIPHDSCWVLFCEAFPWVMYLLERLPKLGGRKHHALKVLFAFSFFRKKINQLKQKDRKKLLSNQTIMKGHTDQLESITCWRTVENNKIQNQKPEFCSTKDLMTNHFVLKKSPNLDLKKPCSEDKKPNTSSQKNQII